MRKAVVVIIIIFSFSNLSAQTIPSETLSMNTGVAPTTGTTSSAQAISQNTDLIATTNNTNEFASQKAKGMKPLLLVGSSKLINPNPSEDKITIVNDELPVNEVRIENTSGQLVADEQTNSTMAGDEVSIDVSKLPSGLYFITTLSGDRTETGSIIVIR
jgi:hypothetical protein